jgi:hypothetical protein
MRLLSVDAGERGIDPDRRVQCAGESSLGGRPLETGEPPAGVCAASRCGVEAADELPVDGDEADELSLR